MLIEITYNVTDVYMSTTETPVYVEISFEQPGGTSAVWGSITGTLSNQTDLQNALNAKFDDPTGTTAQYLRGDGTLATFPALTGYVPYTGATTNVDLGEYELKAGQLTLDVSPTGTATVGTTRWNDTTGVSETTLKGGNVLLRNGVDLVARVVNKVTPNTTLTKAAYQAVRVSGAQGQRLAVAFAQANNDANSADTIGLVIETIPTNQEGFIMAVGQLENINTTGSLQGETWNDGDVLYLSPTIAGAITKVKPTGNGHIVVIGYVEYAHANNGKIYVKVMNGWELDELHDVSIVSVANNEALIYESATSLWKNKSIATALGYTPANAATTLTINGVTYDLSTSRTWTIAAGISGTIATGQVAYATAANTIGGSNNLFWDNTNGRLGIGTNAPSNALHISGFNTTNSQLRVGNLEFQTFSQGNSWFGDNVFYQSPNGFAVRNTGTTGLFYFLGAEGQFRMTTSLTAGSFITSSFGVQLKINANGTFAVGSAIENNSNSVVGANFVVTSNGRTLIGFTADQGTRLAVSGDTLLRGSGNSSATTALTVQNSSSTNLFTVRNDGLSTFGGKIVANGSTTSQSGLDVGTLRFQFFATNNAFIGENTFYNGSAFQRVNTGLASVFYFVGGGFRVGTMPTGSSGTTQTLLNERMYLTNEGSLAVSDTITGGGNITLIASSVLQVDSTTKGFLPPRMTTTQKNAIATPAAGLVVYDTTDNKHYGYNGTTWNAFY